MVDCDAVSAEDLLLCKYLKHISLAGLPQMSDNKYSISFEF
jgi:hypothetical protein